MDVNPRLPLIVVRRVRSHAASDRDQAYRDFVADPRPVGKFLPS
jgi:hypothetical protein